MFPDSQIAKQYKCAKTNSVYIYTKQSINTVYILIYKM
jgi:hypothetical protein